MNSKSSEKRNRGEMFLLMIFLLICSGLGIAAFIISFNKKCGFSSRPRSRLEKTT